MATYPIYRSSKGGQDVYCGDVTAFAAVAALEEWARETGITDYSVDQVADRRYLCPAHSVLFFYTYTEPLNADDRCSTWLELDEGEGRCCLGAGHRSIHRLGTDALYEEA